MNPKTIGRVAIAKTSPRSIDDGDAVEVEAAGDGVSLVMSEGSLTFDREAALRLAKHIVDGVAAIDREGAS